MSTPEQTPPTPDRPTELLRLWRWRGMVVLFWVLFFAGLLPVYWLFSSLAAVGIWCLVFALPLVLSVVVLRLAECPHCNRRLSRGNPFHGLLARTCPHCGFPLSPGEDGDPGS